MKNFQNKFKITGSILAIALVFLSCGVKKPFNIVLLPDTQHYSASYPEIFQAQTEWIIEHADSIEFVLHQGDLTQNNTVEQWKNVTSALFLMDNKVPYTFVAGNHDLHWSGFRVTTFFNEYLPYEKYSRMKGFGGAYEPGKMDNTWHTFKAGGLNWLILSLEFGPRDKVLKWAGEVIEAHPRHKVIINTHTYMYEDNTRHSQLAGHLYYPQKQKRIEGSGEDAPNDGEMMWKKLISRHKNIMLVFSGHVLKSGTGKLVSEGIHGNKVYQMLANYQRGVHGSVNGGNGFLRIITLDPEKNRISVNTYSPYIDEYKNDSDQHFVFEDVRF